MLVFYCFDIDLCIDEIRKPLFDLNVLQNKEPFAINRDRLFKSRQERLSVALDVLLQRVFLALEPLDQDRTPKLLAGEHVLNVGVIVLLQRDLMLVLAQIRLLRQALNAFVHFHPVDLVELLLLLQLDF